MQLLVVEDDTDNREILTFVLKNEGANVTAVGSAQEALEALEQSKPDVILCDILLPDQNGYKLLQQWRERECELGLEPIPVIAVTALATEQDRYEIGRAGFQLHITKPFDIEQMAQVVATIAAYSKSTNPTKG